MAKSQAVYDLFDRNWYNRRATEVELEKAVTLKLLETTDKVEIMEKPQIPLTQSND